MNIGRKMLICATGCLALAMAAQAGPKPMLDAKSSGSHDDSPVSHIDNSVSADNPYGAIVERNVFDLHDPPPPPEKPVEKGPPPNIKLTGIMTIFGSKQALFIVTKPGVAGKPPTTQYLTLNEGQGAGDLEVLEINPKARTAKIKSDEGESVLNIETNKAPSGPVTAPGPPGARTQTYAPPGTPPGFPHNPYAPGGDKLPVRPTRTDAQPNTPAPYNAAQYNPQYAPSYAGAVPTQTAAPPSQPQLSPLEQYTLMEAQRAQALAGQSDVPAAIIPPTPLGQALNQQNEAAQGGPPVPTAPAPPQAPGVRTTGSLGGIYVPGR